MIAIGNTKITKAYLGLTELANIAIGDELLLSSSLPYDAEIEYLESSGNGSGQGQVINSDILIPSECRHVEYHFKFMFTQLQKGVLCGHQAPNYNNPRTYLFYTSRKTVLREFHAGNKIAYVNISALEEVDGYVTLDEDTGKLEYYRKGVLVGQYSMSGTALNRDYPITIFGGSYGNNLDDCASVRIMSFSIVHGNTIVRDFIPVRVGQTGYMYDKVSGTLFGNEGTGSFILGQDKI